MYKYKTQIIFNKFLLEKFVAKMLNKFLLEKFIVKVLNKFL